MKKMFLLAIIIMLAGCEVGKVSPKRQTLYKNSGWDNIQNLTKE